jgi:transposase
MSTVAGIDWASEHHDLRISDAQGALVCERRVAHDERGIAQLIGLLADHKVSRVAIERPEGVVVDRLLEAGVVVLALHPNQVAAARERFASAGKSDRLDAFVLAELARTDAHRFRALVPDGDDTRALRALTRAREDLVATRVGLANQLRAELERSWPAPVGLFADLDSPIGLAFLRRYPGPGDAAALGPARMAAFLARNSYCGRQSPEGLLERLRAAPRAVIGPAEAEARRGIVIGLVGALEVIGAEIAKLTSEIAGAVRAHPDGEIFLSLFVDAKSTLTAATLLGEMGDVRERYPTRESLCSDAGMSPVAIESGKRRTAVFRRACDHRLRAAVGVLADATRHRHPWARDVYTRARARGADHPHAIRILGRAWLRVIHQMWISRTPYDAARHGNLQRLLTAGG